MKNFIQKFKDQLDDNSLDLLPETDYVNSDFWDSLTAVAILIMIEDEYKINIKIEELSEFKSLQELYNFIQKK